MPISTAKGKNPTSKRSRVRTNRKPGIIEQNFYRSKKRFAGIGIAELRWLRTLEEENKKLEQLLADLSLDKKMLQHVLSKNL
jgi:putative transposase